MASDPDGRRYRFEPLDESGVFLGLGIVQCALIGTGLVLSVVSVTVDLPVPLAAFPALAGAAAALARVKGLRVWEWLSVGALWAWAGTTRGRRWFPTLPLVGEGRGAEAALPPCLARLSVTEVPWHGPLRMGAVDDAEVGALSALVPVSGPQFVLAARGDQERLLAGWGEALNHFAVPGGLVTHLAWSDLASPSGLGEHRAWLERPERAGVDPEVEASYRELIDGATATATAHEVLVSVTVARARLPRKVGNGPEAAAALTRGLVASVEALSRGLTSAGLAVGDPLDAAALRALARRRIDPRPAPPFEGPLAQRLGMAAPSSWGPLALETAWDHVRVDGAYHRTYWVAGWPRLAVAPVWLEPFLAHSGVTRSMTVVFRPVPAHQSRRRIERDLVKLASDASTREDQGKRVDAAHRRATQALLDREEELVAGYAEMGYVGLVSVSAASPAELDAQSALLEQVAREAGMELRCLAGRQDVAWAAALPLGLAPKGLLP